MMVLGMIFRKIGWMDIEFAEEMNKFVFLVPLPVLLFSDLATVDFEEVWNIRFVIFCFIVTFISIAIVAGISFLWKDKTIQENLSNHLTGAVQHFWELLSFRISMEMQGWLH